jgi:hypothetical protein
MDLADGRWAYPRIGQLIVDQLVQLLAEPFGDAFIAVRVQVSGYTRSPESPLGEVGASMKSCGARQ